MRQRLVLCVPAAASPQALRGALEAGDVAAVVLRPDAPALAELVAVTQSAGAAALVRGDAWPAPARADGLHTASSRTLIARPEDAVCGVEAANRHDAMLAGEAGADYLWFGGGGDVEAAVALAAWWQALFQTPAVVAGPCSGSHLAALVGSKAEFVAMVDAFDGPEDPADAVVRVNAALDAASPEAGTP